MNDSKKTTKEIGTKWVKRELNMSISPPSIDQKELLWTPLDVEMASQSYMAETNGGGRIESILGIDASRAMTAGLTIGQTQVTGDIVAPCYGQPNLTLVSNTTLIPWRSICQLIITRQNKTTRYGTAWFAGPALLVTAGHCILDHNDGGWASSITVVPGSNGRYPPPFKTWLASGIEAHPSWVSGGEAEFDYGFITLPDPNVGKQLGWFGFAVLPNQELPSLIVNVAGYPVRAAGTMWFNSGRIEGADSVFLRYMIETETGESGGPVFWCRGDQRIVVATHAYSHRDGNKGLRITGEMYKRMLQLRGF